MKIEDRKNVLLFEQIKDNLKELSDETFYFFLRT